jgi:uncharacterized Zn finger protein
MIGEMELNYFQCIVTIRDKKIDKEVPLKDCSIQKISSAYSNTKIPIYKMIINTIPISRNNSYTILYKCQTCESEQEITLNLFMRKVNKSTTRCESCKNQETKKCENQSQFMKNNFHKIIAGEYAKIDEVKVKSVSLENHIKRSLEDWELEDDDFKEHYLLYHLTDDDFKRITSKIISVGNNKITSLEDWNYFSTYRVFNQTRYTPMLVHKNENRTEKPLYIKFKCENCECEFIHRDLEIVKNHLKLFCQSCSLVNRTFHLRKLNLKNGSTILWQSIPERRFIEWCEEHNIRIQNGPKLPYIFHEKQHTYRVDFELPDQRLLVEMKDNHCWHIEQVKTGKFGAKEKAATEWCISNQYNYHVIFPKTLQNIKDSILKNLCKI